MTFSLARRVVLAWIVVALAACGRETDRDAEAAPEARVAVTTTAATTDRVAREITCYGVVEPDPDSTDVVALPRAGVIRRVLVRLGEHVSRGQPLVELDTAPGPQMQWEQAQAAVTYAEEQLARLERLAANGLATKEQTAQARRDLADAEATERSLRSVGANAVQQVLRAPKDAIVTEVSVNAGDRTAADAPALHLAAIDGLIVRLGVEPEIASEIAVGTAVQLVPVFDSARAIEAKVKRVHAMLDSATRLVDVIVPIDVADAKALTLGSPMHGTIALGEIDALVVPREALLRDDSGDHLYTVVDERAHRVDVEVLLDRRSSVAIRGPIAAGDAVIVTGAYQLSDGVRVASDRAPR